MHTEYSKQHQTHANINFFQIDLFPIPNEISRIRSHNEHIQYVSHKYRVPRRISSVDIERRYPLSKRDCKAERERARRKFDELTSECRTFELIANEQMYS